MVHCCSKKIKNGAADDQDENGLHLEKIGVSLFFKFTACVLENSLNLIMVYSPFENLLDIFLLLFYKHFMHDKGT